LGEIRGCVVKNSEKVDSRENYDDLWSMSKKVIRIFERLKEFSREFAGLLIYKYQTGQKWPVPHYVGGP